MQSPFAFVLRSTLVLTLWVCSVCHAAEPQIGEWVLIVEDNVPLTSGGNVVTHFRLGDMALVLATKKDSVEVGTGSLEGWAPASAVASAKDAIGRFDQILKTEPGNARAMVGRAASWKILGRLSSAIRDCEAAIQNDPNLGQARYFRGILYSAASDPEGELEAYSHALRIDPTDVESRLFRAMVLHRMGDSLAALDEYNAAVAIASHSAHAFNCRGMHYQAIGFADRAIDDYTESIRIEPRYGHAYVNRGNVYRDQGKVAMALKDYSEAIRVNPRCMMAYFNRSSLYLISNEYAKALQDADKAVALDPKYSEAYHNRGLARLWLGQFDGAVADCDQAIRFMPTNANAYSIRGRAQIARGQYRNAAADFRLAVAMDPKSHYGYLGLAWLLATCPDDSIRDGKKAVELARKACDMTQWGNWLALETLAAAYAEAGDFTEAVAMQERVLKLLPDVPDVQRRQLENRISRFKSKKPHRDSAKIVPP